MMGRKCGVSDWWIARSMISSGHAKKEFGSSADQAGEKAMGDGMPHHHLLSAINTGLLPVLFNQ